MVQYDAASLYSISIPAELNTIRNYSAIFAKKQPRMQTVCELGKLKSHDKNMSALCVCCCESKSKFHGLRSENVLYMK